MVLHHEDWHVSDFLSNGVDLKNGPWREVQHRWAALAHEEIYELSVHDWKQELKNLAWQYDLSLKWDDVIKAGHNPFNPTDYKDHFLTQAISKDRVIEIDRQVEHDLDVLAAAGERPDGLEYLKANAESRFIHDFDKSSLEGLIAGWKKARELEAGRQEKMKKIAMAQLSLEARQCGFGPTMPPGEDFYVWGFKADPRVSSEEVRYTANMDKEGMRVGYLLVRACMDAKNNDSGGIEPCNDSLENMSRRWSEPAFQDMLDLKTQYNDRCLSYVLDNVKIPATMKDLSETLEKYLDWEYKEKKREKAAYKERRHSAPGNNDNGGNPGNGRRNKEPGDRNDGPCHNGGSNCFNPHPGWTPHL